MSPANFKEMQQLMIFQNDILQFIFRKNGIPWANDMKIGLVLLVDMEEFV